jgi:outer membrane protein, heavy metal efflux system
VRCKNLDYCFLTRGRALFILLIMLTNSILSVSAQPDSFKISFENSPQQVAENSTSTDPPSVTIDNAFKLAVEQNPVLKAARKNMDISQADTGIANYIPNPSVMGTFGWGTTTTSLGNAHQVALEQLVETAGKRKARVRVAKADYARVCAEYNALVWQVREQVQHAYLQLISAFAVKSLMQEQVHLYEKLTTLAQERFLKGEAPEIEVLQAKLAKAQFAPQLIQATTTIELAKVRLNQVVGNTLPPNFTIETNANFLESGRLGPSTPSLQMPLPPLEGLLAKAIRYRQDLESALKRIEKSEEELLLAKRLRIPDIEVSSGYSFLLNNQNSSDGRTVYYQGGFVSASVETPIFHNQKYELAKAEAQLVQSKEDAEVSRQAIRAEVESALLNVKSSRKIVVNFQENLLPELEKMLQLTQSSYQKGETGLASVIQVQKAIREVQTNYLNALIGYQDACEELEQRVGEPLIQ